MALFDLRKRRTRPTPLSTAPAAPTVEAAVEVAAPAPEPPPVEAPKVDVPPAPPQPLAAPLNDPAATGLVLGEAPLPAAPLEPWSPALQDAALALLGRNHDVLLFGLASWGTSPWGQKLLGRARAVVAVDPDAQRLLGVRSFVHQTINAALDGLDWLVRLKGQRFGTVMVGDILTHEPDPLAILRRLHEAILPDGQLVAIVPNATWGEHRLSLAAGEVPRPLMPGSALHRYNADRLRETLAMAGFAITQIHWHRTALFSEATSDLVPDLFPSALIEALGGRDRIDDASVSHLVVRAVPTSPEALLHTLFVEQEQLRKTVRNELARAKRTADALTSRLEDADERAARVEDEIDEARRKLTALTEQAARTEQNIKRLEKEADDANRELTKHRLSLSYRLLCWLQRRPPLPPPDGLREWKIEEPKNRYL